MTDKEIVLEYLKDDSKYLIEDVEGNLINITKNVREALLYALKAGRPKWHKVADGDLPKENGRFFVILENGLTKFSFYYPSEKKFTVWNKEYGSNIKLHNVVAWYEIPKFEEDK